MMERITRVNDILKEWMLEKSIRVTNPEECMDILIRDGIYDGGHGDALQFRNDLRDIRDIYGLPYETDDLIILQTENNRWYIVLKWRH